MTFAGDNVVDMRIARLISMLEYRRPHRSKSERKFKRRFIEPLRPEMRSGNLVVRIPRADGTHTKTLFSCHTDTVHCRPGKQKVVYDADLGVVYKEDKAPLGADDGAGCFLMLEMIRAKVPGTYVFHEGEECGGIGSRRMAREDEKFLEQFDRAVAFDRRGLTDVITHQGGSRCCSDKFATALADKLNAACSFFDYQPDDSGLFTDTANYTEIIPECTNISVGYEGEHTRGEMQDVQHLLALAEALVLIDWDSLPTERDPSIIDDYWGLGWVNGRRPMWSGSRWKSKTLALPTPTVQPTLFERNLDDANREADAYAACEELASEFFQACVDSRYDGAYHQLRMDEVVNFAYTDRRLFVYVLDEIHAGAIDDETVINCVRGY